MQDKRLNIARADEIVFRPHVVSANTRVKKFACHPVLAGLCRDLVGSKPRLYWDQIVYKRPETAAEFPWHQENGYNFVEPQQYLTCWIALTDATQDNGCPWMAPGLHLQGTLHHEWTDLGYRCLDEDDLEAELAGLEDEFEGIDLEESVAAPVSLPTNPTQPTTVFNGGQEVASQETEAAPKKAVDEFGLPV